MKAHPRLFIRRLKKHLSKRGWVWLAVLLTISVFSHFYHPALNRTHSLPFSLFLIERQNTDANVGDYVAFAPKTNSVGGYRLTFVKEIVCGPGQRIDSVEGTVYCDGKEVARAKAHSLKGEPLQAIASGVIPEDKFFVRGTHPDSIDSRYAIIGLIDRCRFSGVAHPIFN